MLDLFSIVNRHFLHPLYYFKNGDKRLHRLKQMESQQWLSPEALRSLQLERIQNLVRYAYDNTRYYREVMDERKLKPEDIRSQKDLEELPVLSKSIIQQRLPDLISTQFSKSALIKDASGGSTGEPTRYYKDLARHNLRRADQMRHDAWCGWRRGERKAIIWGAQRDLKGVRSLKEHIIARYVERQWELDAFELTNDALERFVVTLESIKPSMLLGYANALLVFAEYLSLHKPEHKIRLRGIISSAETLTERKRKVIEKAFHCKVLNRYGSREVGLIASECSHQNGLHINADNVHVEVTHRGASIPCGESGDILVSDLWNFGMPFIRYKLEDIGRLQEGNCPCGRGLPLLGGVEGRSGDFFSSADGKLVHGEYFTHLFYEVPEVKQFQMIQEEIDRITLKIVESEPGHRDPKGDRTYLAPIFAQTRELLGDRCRIDVDYVDAIAPTASGKSLFTISRVKRA